MLCIVLEHTWSI